MSGRILAVLIVLVGVFTGWFVSGTMRSYPGLAGWFIGCALCGALMASVLWWGAWAQQRERMNIAADALHALANTIEEDTRNEGRNPQTPQEMHS